MRAYTLTVNDSTLSPKSKEFFGKKTRVFEEIEKNFTNSRMPLVRMEFVPRFRFPYKAVNWGLSGRTRWGHF